MRGTSAPVSFFPQEKQKRERVKRSSSLFMEAKEAIRFFLDTNLTNFNEKALALFHYQADNNPVYRRYLELLGVDALSVQSLDAVPFLPIDFFKAHEVLSTSEPPQNIFLSSSTSGRGQSRHFVPHPELYERCFTETFRLFYGKPEEYCFLALLPGYLEREGSSLVYMVRQLISMSKDTDSGFYLNDHERLQETLIKKEIEAVPVLLLGVSHALLDFAEKHAITPNPHLIVMETGGMKGRKKEILREELHRLLKQSFSVHDIHSEYGMTELMSQAYSKRAGIYHCPPWMKVLVKRQDDPFSSFEKEIRGRLAIIDLANVYSCAFIETEDLGVVHRDGSFEVLGRMDFSETRGCNVMV